MHTGTEHKTALFLANLEASVRGWHEHVTVSGAECGVIVVKTKSPDVLRRGVSMVTVGLANSQFREGEVDASQRWSES